MIATISPENIKGEVTAAASKSAMQRACALALLHKGETQIRNPGKSNDDLAAIQIIRDLGATIKEENSILYVKSEGVIKSNGSINCGESGLSFRMFAPIVALSDEAVILTGQGSLSKRPMKFFDDVFPLLQVEASTQNGFLPLSIKGPLIPTNISIDGSMSSQYLTGLLFAFAKAAHKPVSITVHGLKSKPYIDLSLQMLSHFGFSVRHENYEQFFIETASVSTEEIIYHTEGDWSGAAFLLVAGAIAGDIRVKGLDIFSAQADRAIMDVLVNAGAAIHVEGSCVLVNDSKKLKAFQFDATDCPDLFPPLVALAAYCEGESVIKGISRLAAKESDRSKTLQDIFTKLGIDITLKDDDMFIKGGTAVHGNTVSSHHDHRIAMAAAVAGLKAEGSIIINDAEAVNKSYPRFYGHLQMLGAAVSLRS